MKPEIFMDDFERTIWGDANYAIIGRALTLSARFEGMCRALSALLDAKDDKNVLESEEGIDRFVKKLEKRLLFQHINAIARDNTELREILTKGRIARNEIAHTITLGLDRCIDLLPNDYIEELMQQLRASIKELAEADRAISFISTVLSSEQLPTDDFLKKYPYLVEEWVMEAGEI